MPVDRQSRRSRKPSLLRPYPTLRFEMLESRLAPAAYTWSGLGANAKWSNPANWVGNSAPTGSPANTEDLVFPAGANQQTSTNDLSSATFNSLTIGASNYNLSGNSLTLGVPAFVGSGFVVVNSGATGNVLGMNIQLGDAAGSDQSFSVLTGASLTVSGKLSGTTGATFTKDGTGTLTLTADNSGFTGPIRLKDNSGALVITNALALGSTTSNTIVGTGSQLRVSSVVGIINEPLILNGLGVANDGALLNVAGTNTWNGSITLNSNAAIGSNAGTLIINGKISDTGAGDSLFKEGPGEVQLNAANTYRGLTTVDNGILTVGNPQALGASGTAASGTVVNTNATSAGQLRMADPSGVGFTIANEFLTLNGAGLSSLANPGSLTNTKGNNTWAGPVTLGSAPPNNADVTLGAAAGTNLTISGVVSSPNVHADGSTITLIKRDQGRVILNNANTYNGETDVQEGTLTARDSNALGSIAAGTTVEVGATLEFGVEAADPLTIPRFDAQGRDLWNDSVTHNPNTLFISEPLTLNGLGFGGGGALRNVSGTNIVSSDIALDNNAATASIGVDLDSRPGHPTPDSSYFTADYSLTVTGTIYSLFSNTIGTNVASDFYKLGNGQLILPVANIYTGNTIINGGWITIQDNNALGSRIPGISDTKQPNVIVRDGAALHLRPLSAAVAPLTINKNISLSGSGPNLPYQFINGRGALMNLGGNNVITGDISLRGQVGIGVEQLPQFTSSTLTTTGTIRDFPTVQTTSFTSSGSEIEQRYIIDTGGTSGTISITYDMYSIPDSLTVYYPIESLGGSKIINTGSVSGTATVTAPFGPGTTNQIEIVMNEGGGIPGTAWDLTKVVVNSVTQGGGIVKYGSKSLIIQGPGTYTGDNTIVEGTIRAQSDTALGLSSSGTVKSQQTYSNTSTTINAASTLELAPSIANLNGGISAGIQMWNENFVLNSAGQQVAVAGAGGTFTLSYGGQSTAPIPITATAAQVQTALNALTTIITGVGSVTVTQSKNVFTVAFGTALSPNALPLIATASGGAEVTVSGGNAPLVNLSSDNVLRGSVELKQGSRVSVNPDSRLSLLGAVTDSTNASSSGSDLAKRGTGDLILGGANTFRGTFGIDEGIVSAMNSQAFGSTTGGTVVANGAQLQIIGNLTVAGEPLTIIGSGNGAVPTFPARWLSTGPSPINGAQTPKSLPATGRVTGVAVDPTDSNVIYVATAGGGAWKTKDGGLSWRPLFDAVTDPNAVMWGGAITIAPNDPRIVYFGTGEDDGSGDSFAGSGVYKSTDAGQTWTLLKGPGNSNPLFGQTVSKIVVDPDDDNTIYLSSGDLGVNAVPAGSAGIWRYNGTSWFNLTSVVSNNRKNVNGQAPYDAANNGPPKTPGPDDDYRLRFPQSNISWTDLLLIRDPGGRTTLYAALGRATDQQFIVDTTTNPQTILSTGVRNAVYQSTTFNTNNPTWFIGRAGGAADSRPTGYPVNDVATGAPRNYNIKLSGVYDPGSGNDVIYAANVYQVPASSPNFGQLLDIQKTTNGGQSWQVTSLTPPNYMGNQGWYNTAIFVFDANHVYVGGQEDALRTADGGTTWDNISTDIAGNGPHVDYHAITGDPDGNIYFGNDGGLWKYDTNLLWSNLNSNLTITEFNGVDPHPTNLGMAAGGSQDNGTELFNNNLAWQWVDAGDGGLVRYNPLNPNILYHVLNGAMRKSTDGGQTWFDLPNLNPPTNGLYFPFVIDPINPQRLVVGGNATPLQMSLDGGNSWTVLTGNFPNVQPLSTVTAVGIANYQGQYQFDPSFPNVSDILSNTYDPNTIYVSDDQGNIAVTKDNGTSWALRPLPVFGTITSIAVDPANRDTVYVTLGTAPGIAGGRIFRSTDAGQNWTNISGNLPLVPTNKIVIDPRTDVGYLANNGGVWALPNISTVSSPTWTNFGSGLPNVKVSDLVLNQTLNTLTIGTYGRGMYQLLIPNFQPNSGAVRVISGTSVWTGPVTLAGNSTIEVDGTQNIQNGIAAASLNIIGVIGDNGTGATLIKTGDGTLTLSGANTYGGQTLVQQGVLQVNNPQALGASAPAATANTVVSAGAALELRSDLQLEPVTINGNGILFNGHYTGALRNVSNNNTYTGLLTLGTNSTIGVDSGTSLTIGQKPGVLAGSGSITDNGSNFGFDKELPGTLILATANNYGGLTRVVQGALQVQDANALGKATGTADGTVVLDGAQLQISRNGVSLSPTNVTGENLSLSGTGIFGTGALINVRGDANPNGSNDNTWSGPINFTMTPNFSPATNPGTQIALASSDARDTLTINTGITQDSTLASMGLIKVGPGRVTLAKTNFFTGVTNIDEGSLRVQDNQALGPITSSEVQTITLLGTTGVYSLAFNGQSTDMIAATATAAQVKAALESLSTIGSGNTVVSETPGLNGKTLTVTFTGTLANQNLPLIVASNQSGLSINVNEAQKGGLGTVVAAGATLELDNTFGSLNVPENLLLASDGVGGNGGLTSAVGNNTYTGSITLGSDSTLGATPGNTLTIASTINDPTPLTVPAPRLRKADFGTVVLQTANPYSGKTIVDQGVLRFQDPLALGTTRSETQTVSVYQQTGTFTLSFNGATTTPLAFNATAGQVETALNNLSSISGALGTVTVSSVSVGGGTQYIITFGGGLANQNLPQISISSVVVDTVTQGSASASEVQTIQVIAGGGQFTLTFNGQTTTPIAVGASSATVAAALNALSTIGGFGATGSVSVTQTGLAGNSVYTVTFGGSLANTNVSQIIPTDLTFNIVNSIFVNTTTQGSFFNIEVQTVQVIAESGQFRLSFKGQTTGFLNVGSTASTVQTALNALSTIGGSGGFVQVNQTGSGTNITYTIRFLGLFAFTDVPQITAIDLTTGSLLSASTLTDGKGAERQTVTVVASNGTFSLTFAGQTTAPIPFNATAAAVAAALNSLSTIGGVGGAVNVTAYPTAGGQVFAITFGGTLANVNVPPLIASTTGGTLATVATANDGPEGTSVTSGATLQIDGGITMSNEIVTINGPGFNGQGALNNYSGNNGWAIPLVLGSNSSVGTTNVGDRLTFTAPITDNGHAYNLDIVDPGTVVYAGTVDNQYTGTTHVQNGTLLLDQATGAAIVGPLVVGNAAPAPIATVRELLGNQIANSVDVTVNETGLFDLNSQTDTIGTLTVNAGNVTTGPNGQLTSGNVTMAGGTINIGPGGNLNLTGNVTATSTASQPALITGPGALNLNGADRQFTVNDGPQASDLLINSQITTTNPFGIIKDGAGRLELAPNLPYLGPTTVQTGDVKATTIVGEIRLAGGSLSGTGTTGVIDGTPTTTPSIGTVNPGVNTNANPAGILHSGSVIWGVNSIYSVNLSTTVPNSPAAGTDYDQLQVAGTVSLGGATLTGTFGAGISFGDRFTIITATGGVTGHFAEPYGPNVVFIQGQKFFVDYSDTTKVVLQKIRADVSVSVTSSQNPSTYGQVVLFTATIQAEPGAGPIPVGTTVNFTLDGVTYPAIAVSTSGTTVTVVFDPQAALSGPLAPGTHTVSATFNGESLNFNTGTGTLTPPQLVEVPVIDPLNQNQNYISPNNSIGVQDSVTFNTTVQKERLATNWTMTITNSGGTTVRVFTGSFTGTGANDTITATWDGKDTGGAFVPDGKYSVVVTFVDSFGNTGTTAPISVTVDNTSPTATIPAINVPIIAPGTSSTVPTSAVVNDQIADVNLLSWVITVKNSGGTIVRTYTGTASANPSNISVTWDGKNQSGAIVPDGIYTVSVQSKDLAGNVSTIATNTIVVLTVPPALTVSTNTPTIYGDAITLTSTISVTIPAVAPLLVGDTIQFRNGATVLGTGTISNIGGVYTATLTVPTFNAGTYPNITAAYLGTSHFLPSVSANFTHVVKPKPITVTADDKTRLYGDPNPPFTYKVVGLTNNDTPATVFTGTPTTAATITSNVGTYPITVGTLAANANYTMTFVNGTLTITKAPLTMTINDATRQVLDPNPTFTATFTGLRNNDPSSVVTGYTITTPATIDSFVGTYPITVTGTPTATNYAITVIDGVLTITRRPDDFGVASASGPNAQINRYSPSGQIVTTVTPPAGFSFTGGTTIAVTDLTGSGYSASVLGTGPGTRNKVVVMSGNAPFEHVLATIFPFEASFTGGVFVSTGFITGNSVPDIIVSPDQTGGPRVQVYRGTDFVKVADFFGIDDPNFRGGVRTAVGDINGDGRGDLVVAAGFGGGPRVAIFDGKSVAVNNPVKIVPDFFAFEPSLRNGAFVAVGDVNGDGFGDLVVGGGPGGGPRVTAFSGKTLVQNQQLDSIVNFFAGDPNSRGGVHVAVKNVDGDDKADLIIGAGDNGGSRVLTYLGKSILGNPNPGPSNLFDAFGLDVTNGVYVG